MRSTVADVMTTAVVSVTEDSGYKQIVQALVEHGVSALPVLDAEGRVLGVVSEEDLLHEEFKGVGGGGDRRPPLGSRLRERLRSSAAPSAHSDEDAVATTAARLMTSPAVTTRPEAPVVAAARLMARRGVKRLPVVDDGGTLVGVVSRRDLLRVFLKGDGDIATAVDAEIGFFLDTPDAARVSAVVADGVVTLAGTVRRRSGARALARLIGRIDGVVAVDDELAWETDDLLAPRTEP
ncbi:CBS domain-containing protein [Nocardiopsis suaedae]|uniref:CBS domain-containing protein n=1 Tax=Nocardiopsis suaedae TaxID=3018444 RepID=A0ABT4TQB3_9ACTN|nr:CBS domain-containing protein [Nocardiopsis suaedae]MDA2806879.1 CBS domain-containing protein [Nocardiopsis suaedae]